MKKKTEPKEALSEHLRLIGRLVAEMCHLHSISQSHDAKVMKILEDKGIIAKDELEAYAGTIYVLKRDKFHLKFCERKLAALGLDRKDIELILADLAENRAAEAGAGEPAPSLRKQ